MRNLTFLIGLLCLSLNFAFCQKKLQLHDIKFSDEIEQKKEEGTLKGSSVAYYYTYIGAYEKALENYEQPLDWGLDTMTYIDSLAFLAYQPTSAKEYLADRLREEQIVIISEAHHKPQHRVFTTELLESLHNEGFRYLGLETITPSYIDATKFLMDTSLNQRKYPLNSPLTGYFTREPQMDKLVRRALELGFVIFGYESISRENERDLQQAINIERFMNRYPDGKVVIHCGWYHAIESDYPKRKSDHYMAYHLKRRTGIDPYTIYQDALSEKVMIPESPYYTAINTDEISVLINKKGEIFNGIDEKQHFDLLIYHPRTKFINNRPNWLLRTKGSQLIDIEKNGIQEEDYPVIVRVFREGEENTVPADIIELVDRNDTTKFILDKGSYEVNIINEDGEQVKYKLEVR